MLASGISAVQGDVVIDDRLFTFTFEPRPTPVIINDNLIDVVATPTTPRSPATITFRPPSPSYRVEASVRTVAAGEETMVAITGAAPGPSP